MPFETGFAILKHAFDVHHFVAVAVGGDFQDIIVVEMEDIPARGSDLLFVLADRYGIEGGEVLQGHEGIGLNQFAGTFHVIGIFLPGFDLKIR